MLRSDIIAEMMCRQLWADNERSREISCACALATRSRTPAERGMPSCQRRAQRGACSTTGRQAVRRRYYVWQEHQAGNLGWKGAIQTPPKTVDDVPSQTREKVYRKEGDSNDPCRQNRSFSVVRRVRANVCVVFYGLCEWE